jgi:hypothetical protein
MEKRMHQIDLSTGEIVEGFVAYVAPRLRNGFSDGWVAMAQNPAMSLARSDLGADDYRVLFGLIARLDYENLLVLNQADLARAIGMQRQHVQRAIKRLIGIGVLLQGPKIGISRSYRLNPEFGWKGKAKAHQAALDEQRNQRMKNAGISAVIDGGRDEKTADMFDSE